MEHRTLAEGRYQLLDQLGEGGMALVYRAYDHNLGVERAIKILAPNFARSSKQRERFRREAKLMARLEHPHIVGVHDVGETNGATYIVMSLLHSGSVHDHMQRFGPIPPAQAAEITVGVLRALHAAHAVGVVHRDIKPHNVLIDALGHVRLADFGIAHSAKDKTLTKTGALMGTWAYMAPEQRVSAKATDARSDVYSVGTMLLHMLRNTEPHDLHNQEAHAEQLADIDPLLADFIRTCTRYNPRERFQSAADALEALEALDLPPLPEGAAPLGTGWIAPGELPPSAVKETNDTLLAWLGSEEQPDVPTTLAPEVETGPVPRPGGVDPGAATALGASTLVLHGAGAPTAVPDLDGSLTDEASQPEPLTPPVKRWPLFAAGTATLLVLGMLALVAVFPTLRGLQSTPIPTDPGSEAVLVAPVPIASPEPDPEPIPIAPEPVPQPVPLPVVAPTPPPTPAPPTVPAPPPTEPEPEEPIEPAAASLGRLIAFSLPESEVFIDGVSQGVGRANLELPVGRHEVRMVPTNGHDPIKRVYVVKADRSVSFCWNFNEGAVCSR